MFDSALKDANISWDLQNLERNEVSKEREGIEVS